jgi:LPXTG cell wall anchor motif
VSAGRFTTVIRRVGLPVALAVIGTVSLAAGVFAASVKPSQVPTTAEKFSEHECEGPLKGLPSDKDGWHFVVPDSQGSGFISITLTFSTSGGVVNVGPITSTDAHAPNSGTGWVGWLDDAKDGSFKHAYVITDAGWELTAANAVLADEKKDATFNLSHTCPGTPPPPPPSSPSPSPSESKSPSPSPSMSPSHSPSASPSPKPSESTSMSPSPSHSPEGSPSASPSGAVVPSTSASQAPSTSPSPIEMLPTTGSPLSAFLIVAGVLLLLGAGLLMVTSRRRLVEAELA